MVLRRVLATGLLGCSMVLSCSDSGDLAPQDLGGAGFGGAIGGSTSAGTTSNDSTGATSGGGSGGNVGEVDPGIVVLCNPIDPTLSECDACVQEKCCQEWLDCTDEACVEEAPCIIACAEAAFATSGFVDGGFVDGGFVNEMTIQSCAASCAINGSVLAVSTNELVTCITAIEPPADAGRRNCALECLSGE